MDTFLELVEIGVVAVSFYIVGQNFFTPTDEKYEEMNERLDNIEEKIKEKE